MKIFLVVKNLVFRKKERNNPFHEAVSAGIRDVGKEMGYQSRNKFNGNEIVKDGKRAV